MNIGKLTTIVSFAAVLAATPALASAPTGAEDATGLTSIGVDISNAGTRPAEIERFVAALPADTRSGVIAGCQTAVANPTSYHPDVVLFCSSVTGAPAKQALGFATVKTIGNSPAMEALSNNQGPRLNWPQNSSADY